MTKPQQTSTDTMSVDKHYVKQQAKWVKEVGLEVGNKVLVIDEADDFRSRFDETVVARLEPKYIGTPVLIDEIKPDRILVADRGCQLYSVSRGGRIVPFYVLIKINE